MRLEDMTIEQLEETARAAFLDEFRYRERHKWTERVHFACIERGIPQKRMEELYREARVIYATEQKEQHERMNSLGKAV